MIRLAPDRRRIAVLAASYAALVGLALLASITVHIHVGALAVVPILFISYYLRQPAALVTASVTGVVLGILDQDVIAPAHVLDLPPLADSAVLALALCAVVIVTNRLRMASAVNVVLRGSLVQARHAAERDPLTGIVNRSYFLRELGEAMERANPGERVAVLFCDLDGFKLINDRYGHQTGDSVLRMAAARLVNTVRAIDVVARLGGDEFGVLARRVHDAHEAAHMAANIERAFADPFKSETERYTIGITVGIGLYPEDGTQPEALLHIADARMYRAKEAKSAARVPSYERNVNGL